MKLKEKIIWITGASSGIGFALAKEMCKENAKIIISGRNKNTLTSVKATLAGSKASYFVQVLDLEDEQSVRQAAYDVQKKFKRVDILINNAGISQRGLAKETHFDVDKRIININLLGTIALTKAVLPMMMTHQQGHIVTVSSLVGKFATPLRSSYAAAKHGLHGFFDALRAECEQDGITVTMICPGFIKTNVSINALSADGKPQGKMDDATAKGMLPQKFAKKAIRAIKRNKREVYIGGKETYAVYLKRFFPGLFARMLKKSKVV